MEKGNDDGLFISSVACCQELWALIMDAGTGFNAQVLPHACFSFVCLQLRVLVVAGHSLEQYRAMCCQGAMNEVGWSGIEGP